MAEYYQETQGTLDLNQDRRVIDIENDIMMLDPNRAPFLRITKGKAGGNKRKIHQPKFWWQEDAHMEYMTTYSGSDESGTYEGTIDLNEAEIAVKGDILLNPSTDEYMEVTAVDASADTVDVNRGALGSTEANLTNGDELINVSDANEEGGSDRDINMRKVETVYNLAQIFKLPWGMTNTQKASKTYGPEEWGRLGRKKSAEFKERIERAFKFGERYEDTSGTKVKRTTRGIVNWISTNVEDLSGASLTEADFDTFCKDHAFAHDSSDGKKILLASPLLISLISGWGKDVIQTRPDDNAYGLNIMTYRTPFGELDIVRDKMLTGDTYGAYGIVVDNETIKYAHLRDTKLVTNVQDNGDDLRKDQYIAEVGLQLAQEERNAIIKNFTA